MSIFLISIFAEFINQIGNLIYPQEKIANASSELIEVEAEYCEVENIYIEKDLVISLKSEKTDGERRFQWEEVIKSGISIHADSLIIEGEIYNVRDELNSQDLKRILNLFKENKTRISKIILDCNLTFSLEDLNQLIKITKPNYFCANRFLPIEVFENSLLKSLDTVILGGSNLGDEELLALDGYKFFKCDSAYITSRGINALLKKWKRGECKISSIYLSSESARFFEEILEDLNANPIWTPFDHKNSLIAKIPLDDLFLMQSGDPIHFYSIWRSDDIYNPFFLKLQKNTLRAFRADVNDTFFSNLFVSYNEKQLILHELNEQHCYEITGKCKWCREYIGNDKIYKCTSIWKENQFCHHRRRISIERFKNFWPKLWDFLITSVEISKHLIELLHYPKIVLRSSPIMIRRRKRHYWFDLFQDDFSQENWVIIQWKNLEFMAFYYQTELHE